jgi:hypothetical protein
MLCAGCLLHFCSVRTVPVMKPFQRLSICISLSSCHWLFVKSLRSMIQMLSLLQRLLLTVQSTLTHVRLHLGTPNICPKNPINPVWLRGKNKREIEKNTGVSLVISKFYEEQTIQDRYRIREMQKHFPFRSTGSRMQVFINIYNILFSVSQSLSVFQRD